MEITRVTYLFHRYFNRIATEEEKVELMKWISCNENDEEVKTLMDNAWEGFKGGEDLFTPIQSRKLLGRILQKDLDIFEPQEPYWRRIHWIRTAAAVASILILFAVGGYFWMTAFKRHSSITVMNKPSGRIKYDAKPGGNKAMLKLANGQSIVLNALSVGQLIRQGNSMVVKINSGLIKYSNESTVGRQSTTLKQNTTLYNTLSTPKGGQYQLLLPDGSRVWLNAASSIHFPTAFTGTEREVEITGEAYFKIVKDEAMPFKVKIGGALITVLGTQFNVNDYSDEPTINTTLVEGAIKITDGNQSKLLRPGEQAIIQARQGKIQEDYLPRTKNNIQIKRVDIKKVIAWKDGLFYFENDNIATIMSSLSKWYNVRVSYEGPAPTGYYSGIMSRNTNLSVILNVLKTSGIHFKIEGKNLIVSR